MSDDALIDAAELGEEARNFIGSDLGKKVLELADEEVEAALKALGDIDATRTEDIRALQMRARFGRTFAEWLGNILHEGENALHTFQQQRHTE